MHASDTKANIRREVTALCKGLGSEQKIAASIRACDLQKQQGIWQSGRAVLLFAPLPDELDIWPLVPIALASGKVVCLPRFDPTTRHYLAAQIQNVESDIQSGQFGIREPAAHCAEVPLNRLDLILVPGVAFDLCGRRLGRGKGFYDHLLANAGGLKCGVAFNEQIVAEIPVEPHDVSVNCILTPTRWIEP